PAAISLNIPILSIATESLVVDVAVPALASDTFKLIDLFSIAAALSGAFVKAGNMQDLRFAK
ncbi:MAG TPA: hypothetical protein PLF23_22825, partial [Candidatus Obscuribacter sp.]|nr:hypothetical protein [Candidatus Obscuribacter sp.]